jgi:hypothetical protein
LQRLVRVWAIHKPVVLVVRGTPDDCLAALNEAARPRVSRLELRSLYTGGRRYEIARRGQGFRLRTTHKVWWHPRRRSTSAAVMKAKLAPIDADITHITLTARLSIDCIVNALIFPTAMAFIIGGAPWPLPVISTILGLLYGLSWTGNRANAALEVNELVYFVQTALEHLGAAEMPTLAGVNGRATGKVYSGREFRGEWEKFYRQRAEQAGDEGES